MSVATVARVEGGVEGQESARSRWIIAPAADLGLFVFVTLLTLGPWLASDRLHVPGFYILAVVALANGPHLISTWTRVYLPRRERFRRPLHYWLAPGLLAAFAIGCMAEGGEGPILLRTVIFYWASWHFMAQAYGILRIYQRKHEVLGSVEARLEKALLFAGCIYCVARRVFTGPWDLFGVPIHHPHLPAWLINGLGAGVVVLGATYFGRVALARLRSDGRRVPLGVRPLLVLFTLFGFAMPFLVIRDGTSAFAAAALWHAVQYIGIVWHYNRTRYAGRLDPDARAIAWASQPGRTLAYVGLIALCAAAVYALVVAAALFTWTLHQWSLTLWTALTLGHYYLDGVIWKFKQYDLGNLVRAPA